MNDYGSGRIISNDWRLAYSQTDVARDLIVDGNNDLALVSTLIWPLYVLNLQSVSGTGRIVPHAGSNRFFNQFCVNGC